jgi:ribose transport system permease protein
MILSVETYAGPARWVSDHIGRRRVLGRLTRSRYTGVLFGIVALCAYLAITEPVFLTWENWQNIIRAQTVVLVLALGMTFVVLLGGIDLSIASAATGSAMTLGVTIQHGAPWWIGCLAALGVGLGFGLANGIMIGILHIPFFVVTLGTLSIYQSVALLMTNGETVSLFGARNFNVVQTIINGNVGPFPSALLIGAILCLISGWVLRWTSAGRAIYAVGSNPEAARLAGIRVPLVLVSVYTVAGLAAGLAAIVQTGRLTAAGPQVDPNLMLTVIAAVLIGGTSFTGGDGGVIGTVIGVLFLGVIQNGLELGNVSTFAQGTVSGSILILAVGFGILREYSARRAGVARSRRARQRRADTVEGPMEEAEGMESYRGGNPMI